MRYLDEFRSGRLVSGLGRLIRRVATREWTLMEICGGQTHTIVKYGIEDLLPPGIRLIHGPGCPVCVTPLELIDKAIAIASQPHVIFTSFGDMLRVPGSRKDLLRAKAEGCDVRIIYSPLDAVKLAKSNPQKQVVFFAVGFETTAPANAMAVVQAAELGLRNFSVLCAHVLVAPAIEAILSADGNEVQALLAAGHVCTVTGYEEYAGIADRHSIPIVVTGFEPVDILQGIWMALNHLEEGRCGVQNQYGRVVRQEGNRQARNLMAVVYEVTDRKWRGIGEIPASGLKLREELSQYDAEKVFDVGMIAAHESHRCIAGSVLRGRKKPVECPAFGAECIPEHPLGAPMVSSEGACAAYYQYARVNRGYASYSKYGNGRNGL